MESWAVSAEENKEKMLLPLETRCGKKSGRSWPTACLFYYKHAPVAASWVSLISLGHRNLFRCLHCSPEEGSSSGRTAILYTKKFLFLPVLQLLSECSSLLLCWKQSLGHGELWCGGTGPSCTAKRLQPQRAWSPAEGLILLPKVLLMRFLDRIWPCLLDSVHCPPHRQMCWWAVWECLLTAAKASTLSASSLFPLFFHL